jgi:hypothetical protein
VSALWAYPVGHSISDELLYPNTFLCGFISFYVLTFIVESSTIFCPTPLLKVNAKPVYDF